MTVSTNVIQSMFNHLTASYSADEAREILIQKYPDAEGDINLLTAPEVETAEVESVETEPVVEAQPEPDLVKAVKAKTAKPVKPKQAKAKAETKADIARKLYAEATDKSRGAMIKVFQDKLGMSKAAASTYFYNIKS